MGAAILCLIVVGVGLSAYARARQSGQWSWALFAATLAGAAAIAALATAVGLWLAALLGPNRAGLATLLIVGIIAAGVVVLTIWVNRMTKRLKR